MTARRMINLGFTEDAFPEGTHMCYIYADDEERAGIISKFIESGLPQGEAVGYFADLPCPEDVPAHLAGLGIHLPHAQSAGCFHCDLAERIYCPDGTFVPRRMWDRIMALYLDSVCAGHSGVRASGEMTWALKDLPGTDDLITYESGLNSLVLEWPATLVCQYDARRFSGATLYDVLQVHPYMIVQGQIVRNPNYTPS